MSSPPEKFNALYGPLSKLASARSSIFFVVSADVPNVSIHDTQCAYVPYRRYSNSDNGTYVALESPSGNNCSHVKGETWLSGNGIQAPPLWIRVRNFIVRFWLQS